MTNQEIFDKVVNHLRKQGCKALNENGARCCYRTKDGKKCAVGCLIDDNDYGPGLENKSVWQLPTTILDKITFTPVRHVIYRNETMRLLSRLQSIHDGDCVEYWEELFLACANEFTLVFTPKKHE